MTFAHGQVKNDRPLEKSPSTCTTITEFPDEVLEKESSNISFSRRLQLFSTGSSSHSIRTHWNSCVVETYSFVLQPTTAFQMCVFVIADASSRSAVLDLLDMPLWYVPLDFFITTDVETPFDAGTRCFLKARILDFNWFQATSHSFRLIRASLRGAEESEMLVGLDFVSHVTLLPLRCMGFSGMIAGNMQPQVPRYILTGQRPPTYLDVWGVEARIQPRSLERVRRQRTLFPL